MRERLAWRRALLDGGAVLLGILTAFAIDAAWDARGERIRGEAYRGALDHEARLNRTTYEERLAQIEVQQREMDRIFRTVVYAERAVPRDTLLGTLLGNSLGPWTIDHPRRGALGDLLSAAGAGHVEDPALRGLLTRYDRQLAVDVERQREISDHWSEHLSPYVGRSLSLPDLLRYDLGVPAMQLASFDLDATAFVRSRDFASLLAHRAYLLFQVQQSHLALLETIDEVVAALGAPDPAEAAAR